MEVLISFVAAIAGETARSCLASPCSTVRSAVRFDVDEWETEATNLFDLRNYVKRQVEELAEQDGRSPATDVRNWLREVGEIEDKANSVRAGLMAANSSSRLCGFRVRCKLRLKAARMLEKMQLLLKSGAFPGGLLSENCSTRAVEYMAGPSIEIEGQATASRALAELMERLDDSGAHRIGVWGMAGVGKTTLVKILNNKLENSALRRPFSCVIWATVSKDLDVKRVQLQICERLNLVAKMEESVERTARRLYQRLEKEERFLLILDDVWESVDLDCLGIPPPERGSKVLLTSRFSDVCRQMMTDVEVKLNTLSQEEAWRLFSGKAGEVASLEHVKPFAEAVARECCGLPLALITVGTAMRGKRMVELWKHALKELQRSAPCIGGIKDKVYSSVKWSYDSLEGNKIRACFLYCALFPEDYSIDVGELVWYWLAEGLIDEQQSYEDSVNNGISLLETLKDCCLLENGARERTVKMHDVVRDVAIWIGSSLEDNFRSLVCSGIDLSEVSVVNLSDSLQRVSFMNNKINKLPDCETHCEQASTLLLQGNFPLEDVPERFLQGFRSLRVLNASGTQIQSLPPLLQLTDLRALMLGNCFFLEELPSLERLVRLQVLDLRATSIRELPKHMANLINLRQVNLSYTHYLEKIEAGILSNWTRLEVLDMKFSTYCWGLRGEVGEGQASFEELRCLERLFSLSISLKSIQCLGYEDLTWITMLRKFRLLIGPTANPLPTRFDERWVAFGGLDLSREWIKWSLINATSLDLDSCQGADEMLQNLAISSVVSLANGNGFGSFLHLKSLAITNSETSFRPGGGCRAPYDLLPNLEELRLDNVSCIQSISELVGHLGLLFSKLKLIEVSFCAAMISLLSYGGFMLTLPNLETIKVRGCSRLEKLFSSCFEHTSGFCPVVPNLRTLQLNVLNSLESLCKARESWPSLERINVVACNRLKKLPLFIENANFMKEIRGESHWWNRLEWDDAATKSALQCYFVPHGPE